MIFNVIGKKNNQEIPTLGLTDNAGNSVKRRFRHYPFTLGFGFLYLHHRPMIDSI